jgi:GWxTD domain-containing protein
MSAADIFVYRFSLTLKSQIARMRIFQFVIIGLVMLTPYFGKAQSGQLKAYIDQKNFFAPDAGTFLELHYQFVAYTLRFDTVPGGMQAKIAMGFAITDLKGDTVVQDRYVLASPIMRDSVIEDFFDIQRIALKPGKYSAYIELQDLVSKQPALTGKLDVDVPNLAENIQFSSIMVAEVASPSANQTPFTKSGYEIIPRISNFYGQELSKLPYYVELYHTNLYPDTIFGFRQRIINTNTNQEVDGFTRFVKMKTAPVIPVLRTVDLSKLPTGSYRLELDAVDRENKMLTTTSSYYFERINEIEMNMDIAQIVLDPAFQGSITEDSVAFFLGSLLPISRQAESRTILKLLKEKNPENQRKYIQQFWVQTAPDKTTEAWTNYKKQVLLVQSLYANNFQDGFETDRGRVYLQYGPPNNIMQRETSPTEYPYEIWYYDKIKMYSNKRFIFYNPDLVNNAYRLLHSDMIGELQNYKWQIALIKRDTPDSHVDDTNGGVERYGGNSNLYYRQY